MSLLQKDELANIIRREWEYRGWNCPDGLSSEEFEKTLTTLNRRYLEQLAVALQLDQDMRKG
jgi:hypothetical protein